MAQKLIEAGADVNARDADARSAWTWAHWGGNEALVTLLESRGAETSGKSHPFEDGGAPVDRFEKPPKLTKYRAPEIPKEPSSLTSVNKIRSRRFTT